jgi:hypothetical protein
LGFFAVHTVTLFSKKSPPEEKGQKCNYKVCDPTTARNVPKLY